MIFLVVYVGSVSFMKHNLATLKKIYSGSKWGFTNFDVFLLSVRNYLSFRNKTWCKITNIGFEIMMWHYLNIRNMLYFKFCF